MRLGTWLGFLLILLLTVSPVRAERLVFQKGDTLYSATEDGKDARPLFSLPSADTRWAISPDGRRIVYVAIAPEKAEGTESLATRPVAVYLSDLSGRRRKRLFNTSVLSDRLGRRVTRMGVAPSELPRGVSNRDDLMKELESFDNWTFHSLAWSADSRTLYFSCYKSIPPFGTFAGTFTVDAAAGLAIVDADGRWKSVAPLLDLDARGTLLVGVPDPLPIAGQSDSSPTSIPLVVANLAEGTRFTHPLDSSAALEYTLASQPALAPENRAIAFFAAPNKGLWITDKFAKSYRRLVEGIVRRPRFSSDGKQALFLLPRPGPTDPNQTMIYDLYSIGLEDGNSALAPPPTLVLQGVNWFDIVPN